MRRRSTAFGRGVLAGIADATWTSEQWRRAAEGVAAKTTSRLVCVECVAPPEVAAARAQQRFRDGGAESEADARVARSLGAQRVPWPDAFRVATNRPIEQVVPEVRALIESCGPGDRR